MDYLRTTLKIFTSLCVLLLFSCNEEETVTPKDREISITDDVTVLSKRISLKNEPVNVIPEDGSGRVDAENISLTLKGELSTPTADGKVLHATSISQKEDLFVVSYNFPGAEFGGAIDLLNSSLELTSQIVFGDADISDVSFLNEDLYFVGGTSSLEESAFVERIKVDTRASTFSLDNQVRASVGKYVATSVTTTDNQVFVTTGDAMDQGGGLYQLNSSLGQENYHGIQDARWVTHMDKKIYVASGIPDKIGIWNPSNLSKENEFDHNGFTKSGAKMTIDVADDLVFVAGGTEGILIYDLEGHFVAKHTFGDESFTNAVTAENGKVFISNGLGGVYVATYDPFLNIIGKLDLDKEESVNHIELHQGMLYVASGIGGVKMIEVN